MTRPTFPVRPGLSLVFGLALVAHIADAVIMVLEGVHRPWWRTGLLMVAFYFLCICIHDAVHRVLVRHRGTNQLMGFLFGLMVGLPFPLLQKAHLHHHRRVGFEDDPEAVVYRTPFRWLWLRLPLVPVYYLRTLKQLTFLELFATALHLSIVAGVIAGGLMSGIPVLQAWALPALGAVMWFGFTTVYVPHGPESQRWMKWFTAHSGWHDDHHADPRYPFAQYAQLRAFRISHGTAEPLSGAEGRRIAWLATPLRWPSQSSL